MEESLCELAKRHCRPCEEGASALPFVNAVAWIAHDQGHHPDLEVSYRHCRVSYTTHAIGGLSDNDFICAARVEGLFSRP